MQFTPFIAAAILAYTAGSVPIKPSHEKTNDHINAEPSDVEIGPLPVTVAPNGLMVPTSRFQPSSLTGSILEDHSQNSEDMEDLPTVTDLGSKEGSDLRQLHSRATMWKPVEIDNYHEDVKIDLKNSILELRDKLAYLNKEGRLTLDQASQQIDHVAKVIATRIRINFVTNPCNFDEMLSALQKHIIVEIQNREKDPHSDPPLNVAQQAAQDALFANLHAHYILEGLEEKIVLLARTRKLNNRLGRLSIGQARQMIDNTPNISQNDLAFSEKGLKRIEKAMGTMIEKKLVNFPAAAVSAVGNPIKSDFRLPGEDVFPVETLVESQPDYQTSSTDGASSSTDASALDADAPAENLVDGTEVSADFSQLSRRSVPTEKRQVYRTKEEAYLDSNQRKLTTKDKVAFLHRSQDFRSELSRPRYSSANYNNRISKFFLERQRQRFTGSRIRLHGRDLPDAPYESIMQLTINSTSTPLPDAPEDFEVLNQAVSRIGQFQNALRYLELTDAPWEDRIQLVHDTTEQLMGIEGVPAELIASIDDYFQDIGRYVVPSNQDLNKTMTNIEGRSAPVSKPMAFQDNPHEIMSWRSHGKRHAPISDFSADVINITTTPTMPTEEEEEDGEPFWIDFDAPECMKFILDEDLDQAKLAMFVTCEENATSELHETQETLEAFCSIIRTLEKGCCNRVNVTILKFLFFGCSGMFTASESIGKATY
ncbi:hypothetical protein BKA65DRAFT_598330 [Rhexocercosporidium sp. MPI-PUGE-AT-0058]|nr:hypothetical protein BKA65DRAFT_598330 [Rhexocercosporidium sp. MPI-PUGE-AT-0058]